MNGIQYGGRSYGSLDDTIILIEADESTPLLVDRRWIVGKSDGNNNNNDAGRLKRLSIWSFTSKSPSQGSDSSTKSFRSHFWELKVLAFALLLITGLSIAIYLLIIESRLPSITFSLDLVHHDVWSLHRLPMGHQLNAHNVDSVIITQTGSQNCDNPIECQYFLQQMQEDYSYSNGEELPYNFVIGCEGVAYEVRGWNFESGMPGVDQPHTLVIGIIGNFNYSPPSHGILQTVHFLITESVKRRKLLRTHNVVDLSTFCMNCQKSVSVMK